MKGNSIKGFLLYKGLLTILLITEIEFVGALRSLNASVQNVSLDEDLLKIAPHHIGFKLANFSTKKLVL